MASGKSPGNSSGKQTVNSAEEIAELQKACEEFDYVRFVTCSILGESYLKAVPRRHLNRFLESGTKMWDGMALLGAGCQLYHEIIDEVGTGNLTMRPMPGTAHAIPWATEGKHKVGVVICEPVHDEVDEPVRMDPRYVARQQLQRLHDRGLTLRSACEMEFQLLTKGTLKPIVERPAYATTSGHAALEDFMYSVDEQLYKSGVNLENLLEEYAAGQLEFVLTPAEGIDAADQVFKFKQALREMATQHGYSATFMSMPFDSVGNGMHFNHSVIERDSKKNAFYDADLPDGLSEFARHWIGGLMKHAKSLTALCCPTINCMRRIGAAWAPGKITWGLDDRNAAFRVKNMGEKGTFMENRLPGGGSNPYVVLAATIAAGLDGVENKIECPPAVPIEEAKDMLPNTLEKAMVALKEDEVMCKALGESFIRWFLMEKEYSQLKEFPDWDPENKSDEQFAKERDFYLLYI